jgi:hypothetical protein
MPRLQQAIQEALPNSELLSNLTADEVMAVGCCNQAAVIGEPWDTICQFKQVSVPAISKGISVRVSSFKNNNQNRILCIVLNKITQKCLQFIKCGDEEESQTTTVFCAQTPLSSRFSLPVPLGKKHNVAIVDVFEDTELVAKVTISFANQLLLKVGHNNNYFFE